MIRAFPMLVDTCNDLRKKSNKGTWKVYAVWQPFFPQVDTPQLSSQRKRSRTGGDLARDLMQEHQGLGLSALEIIDRVVRGELGRQTYFAECARCLAWRSRSGEHAS